MDVVSPPIVYWSPFRIYGCSKSGLKARGQKGFHKGQAELSGNPLSGLNGKIREIRSLYSSEGNLSLHVSQSAFIAWHQDSRTPLASCHSTASSKWKGDYIPLNTCKLLLFTLGSRRWYGKENSQVRAKWHFSWDHLKPFILQLHKNQSCKRD